MRIGRYRALEGEPDIMQLVRSYLSHVRTVRMAGVGVTVVVFMLCGSLVCCCTCNEPPLYWVSPPSGPGVVCVGETFSLSASAADPDLIPGATPPCTTTGDSITYTGLGPHSFGTPGIHVLPVTANDAGSPVEDGIITGYVSVVVVAVASVTKTSPSSCVVCTGNTATFQVATEPAGYYDKISWSAPGGTPSSQTGGQTFSTSFAEEGDYTVTASCCSSSASASIYAAEPLPASCGNATCSRLQPAYAEIDDECITGATTYQADPGPTIELGYDCAEYWSPVVTHFEWNVSITYDSKGRVDVDQLYTCEAVAWVDHEGDYLRLTGETQCHTDFYSRRCLEQHEEGHADQICEVVTRLSNEFIEDVEQYKSSACSRAAAAADLDPWVTSRGATLSQSIANELANAEQVADERELGCLDELKAELCSYVGTTCTWCE